MTKRIGTSGEAPIDATDRLSEASSGPLDVAMSSARGKVERLRPQGHRRGPQAVRHRRGRMGRAQRPAAARACTPASTTAAAIAMNDSRFFTLPDAREAWADPATTAPRISVAQAASQLVQAMAQMTPPAAAPAAASGAGDLLPLCTPMATSMA